MNTKMKVLSLALIGAFGYVGSAAAGTCPAGPTVAEGGAWTSKSVLPPSTSSVAITTPGLDTSACRMNASLGPTITAQALVRDDTPTAEPRYRFQFLVDTSTLGDFSASDNVVVFQGLAATTANGISRALRVSLVAGPAGAKRVRFQVACGTGPTFLCAQSFGTDLLDGVNRIEGDLVVGATGSLRAWVNAAAGTTEPAVDLTISSGDSSPWGGVESAQLGLVAPSAAYKNNHATEVAGFDAFDSRRQTYIGS
jgi:hypothetical protein